MSLYRNDKELNTRADLDIAIVEVATLFNWPYGFLCDVQQCLKSLFEELPYLTPYEFVAGDDGFRMRWDRGDGTELTLYGWQGDTTEDDTDIPLELDVAVREIKVRAASTDDPENPGAAMQLLKRELPAFREKGKGMETNKHDPDDGRDIYGNLTLSGLLKALDEVFTNQDWPGEACGAFRDFVTELYGDKPENFLGPGHFEYSTNHDDSTSCWLELIFENENSGYRDVVSLCWKVGKLWARCEVEKTLTFEGVETTLRIMRDRCGYTTTLGGDDDGRWRIGDCAVAPVGHVAGEMLFRIALVTGVNPDGSLLVDTLIHGPAGAMTVTMKPAIPAPPSWSFCVRDWSVNSWAGVGG